MNHWTTEPLNPDKSSCDKIINYGEQEAALARQAKCDSCLPKNIKVYIL